MGCRGRFGELVCQKSGNRMVMSEKMEVMLLQTMLDGNCCIALVTTAGREADDFSASRVVGSAEQHVVVLAVWVVMVWVKFWW